MMMAAALAGQDSPSPPKETEEPKQGRRMSQRGQGMIGEEDQGATRRLSHLLDELLPPLRDEEPPEQDVETEEMRMRRLNDSNYDS